jgi:hypothetical protein
MSPRRRAGRPNAISESVGLSISAMFVHDPSASVASTTPCEPPWYSMRASATWTPPEPASTPSHVDEEALDAVVGVADLLVALVAGDGGLRQLQAVQRALAGQRVTPVALPLALLASRIGLADRQREQGVVAEHVVVVQVLVAAQQAQHALREQLLDGVLDSARVPVIPVCRVALSP